MDFQHAKKIFAEYLEQYDTANDKIRLKIVHTYGVVSAAEYLAEKLALSETDALLARHIALLHDIGRFEQLRLYNSFDDSIMPHAQCSLDILFKDRLIEQFIPERDYDSVIFTAIKNHGLYSMEPGLEGAGLLHSQMIRDADKLDNFRVKLESDFVTLVGVPEETLGAEAVSPHVFEKFMNETPILNSERITHMDMWVSYLGYIFDLNFPASRRYLKERGSIRALVGRIAYTNPETARQMDLIRQKAEAFIR